MHRRTGPTVFALALWLGACVEDPAPLRDPLDYLRIGADFEAEADAFAAQLAQSGWAVERRQTGRTFAALIARQDERALVRVWSQRGLVVAIDAPSPDHWRRDVLLAPPTAATDLDGDGHEELVLGATDDALDRTCFAIVRIDAEGFAREVTPVYQDLGGDECVEGFTEVGERLRAMVVVRFPELAGHSVPQIAVPHSFDRDEGWQPAIDAAFLERERLERSRALARGAIRAHRAAIELAAIAHLAGEDTGGQLAAFDANLGDMVDAASAAARAHIARGWEPEVPDAEGEAPER